MNERIRELRKKLGMNQENFAAKLGLNSKGTISAIENSQRELTDRLILQIISEFNINEEWLKTGKGDMFKSSPYEKEFIDIFETLEPVTQKYLVEIAKSLFEMQKELLLQNDKKE